MIGNWGFKASATLVTGQIESSYLNKGRANLVGKDTVDRKCSSYLTASNYYQN